VVLTAPVELTTNAFVCSAPPSIVIEPAVTALCAPTV